MLLRIFLLALAAAAAGNHAVAVAATISPGARLAATCAACHGTDGATKNAPNFAALPALAGQPRENLAASLRAYKAGVRPATIMTQIAKGYTDEQIDLLAAYFAARKK
jgi:sulfide dehydrogenase cytochrome subunit